MIAGRNVRRALARTADRPLLVAPSGAGLSGRELGGRVERLAGALAGRGLRGGRIGLWFQNGWAAYEAFLAVELIGGTRVPVDPGVPGEEARGVFEAAAVDVALADGERATMLGGDVLVHDDRQALSGHPWRDEVAVAPDRTLVLYPRMVAGGRLFGVSTSYRNWDTIMSVNQALFQTGWYGEGFDETERFLTVQQLMHGTGMVGSIPFLLMGLPQLVLPRFEPGAVLDAIRRHGVTATFTVPGMLTRLADVLEAEGAGARLPLRHTLYGGAPIEPDEIRRLLRVLGPHLVQLYGRFEAGGPLPVLGAREHGRILSGEERLARSCGRPVPGIEIRVRPLAGRPDGEGELCTRSGMVSPDYADPEGWCALGDVAAIDRDGYVHLRGRLDRMINTGSYHVYPDEVEEAIGQVAGVWRSRVRGEPDPVWGQAVTAYVVPARPGAGEALIEDVRAAVRARLARYKVPKAIHLVDELPLAGPTTHAPA